MVKRKLKLLITGSTGFLGRALLKRLSKEKYTLYCIIRDKSIVHLLPKSKNINYVYGHLEDPSSINDYFSGIDICVHLAAETKSSSKKRNFKSNVLVTKNIINLCKKNKVKKIIFTSSINTRFKKLGVYGSTKLDAENLIKNSELSYVIFLPTMIYGKGDKGLSKTIQLIKKLPIIPIIGNGKAKMQPVFVDDVTFAIEKSLAVDIKNRIYYLGGRDVFTFNKFIFILMEKLNIHKIKFHLPLSICYYSAKLFSKFTDRFPISLEQCLSISQNKNCDNSQAKKDLGYKPISFKDGLDIILNDKTNKNIRS